jgi:hypothetical protein
MSAAAGGNNNFVGIARLPATDMADVTAGEAKTYQSGPNGTSFFKPTAWMALTDAASPPGFGISRFGGVEATVSVRFRGGESRCTLDLTLGTSLVRRSHESNDFYIAGAMPGLDPGPAWRVPR